MSGLLAPGILIAATGVGAGDLMTASLGGSAVGSAIAWAAVVGAVLKLSLNEGIARWQMATGTTLLEGWSVRLGGWIQWAFLAYLGAWSLFTGAALISACGVAGAGLLTPSADPEVSRVVWGILHSVAGLLLAWLGGFRLFERLMAVSIAVMFVTVIVTAALAQGDGNSIWQGLTVVRIPASGLPWALGILGGVGGTVTLLCYGYWIREESRAGLQGLRQCRVDLTVGYLMTAIFGVAMIKIGAGVELEGRGASTALILARQLEAVLGRPISQLFLVGFWGAVFSSLLGVWQGVPYLFADLVSLRRRDSELERSRLDLRKSRAYRLHLAFLSIAPLPLLWISVGRTQLAYAIFGSLFMPLLACTLVVMNNRQQWVGKGFRNGWLANGALVLTLALFVYLAFSAARRGLGELLRFGV